MSWYSYANQEQARANGGYVRQYLNLFSAIDCIDKFFIQAKTSNIPDTLLQQLKLIRNQIIQLNFSAKKSFGQTENRKVLFHYHRSKISNLHCDETVYNHQEIQAEVIATYHHQLNQVQRFATKWLVIINELCTQYQKYILFLSDLKNHIQTILDHFSEHPYIKVIKRKGPPAEDDLPYQYVYRTDVFIPELYHILAEYFAGTSIFIKQFIDPFIGKELSNGIKVNNEGMCAGYVYEWASLIGKNGFCSAFPFAGIFIQEAQKKQGKPYRNQTNLKTYYYVNITLLRNVIDDLVKQLLPGNIYGLKLGFHSNILKKNVIHMIGIRYSSNRGIEFFDPNYAIFVFPNLRLFTAWLNVFFKLCYSRCLTETTLNLIKIGKESRSFLTIPLPERKQLYIHRLLKYALKSFKKVQHLIHDNYDLYERTTSGMFECLQVAGYYTAKKMMICKDRNELRIDFAKANLKLEKIQNLMIQHLKSKFQSNNQLERTQHSDYHALLKNTVLMNIAHQSSKLNEKSDAAIINALQLLVEIIQDAPSCITLKYLMDSWLDTKTSEQKSYRNIISGAGSFGFFSPKIYPAIYCLSNEFEINDVILTLLQVRLLIACHEVIKNDPAHPLFTHISKLLNENKTPRELIIEIKNICIENRTKNQFELEITLNIRKKFIKLNPDNRCQLEEIALEMRKEINTNLDESYRDKIMVPLPKIRLVLS